MALVTSQSTLPDFEYEHHTVILDNLDHGSDNTDFTLHLPTPLENVVQAQLLAASINTTGDAQRCIHIGIEELKSFFTQRGKRISMTLIITLTVFSEQLYVNTHYTLRVAPRKQYSLETNIQLSNNITTQFVNSID